MEATTRSTVGGKDSGSRVPALLAFGLLFVLQVLCMHEQRTPFFEDDALFFFRYAENLAAGHGYRWNIEEPPVWGASAPLWPLLLAAGVKLGLSVQMSSLLWSWSLALGATGLLGLVTLRVAGVLGVLALAPLLSINFLYSTWATTGMESPLTYLLIVGVLAVACAPARGLAIGAVAGLCMVHKLDLVPLGLVLLGVTALWRKSERRSAALTALCIAGAWYAFATWYFGQPVPNSFLRKLNLDNTSVGPAWFVRTLLLLGAGPVRLPLLLLGLIVLRERRALAAVAFCAIAVPAVAYALKPPQEQFTWYAAAVSPVVAFLGACGLGQLFELVVANRTRLARASGVAAALGSIAWLLVSLDYPRVRASHLYLTQVEPPLIQAGEWVQRNTPPEATVLTGWGHVAYASRRFVYDSTFLNRRPEAGDLINKYSPDVFIKFLWTPPAEYVPPRNYHVAQIFRPPPGSNWKNSVLVLMHDRFEDAQRRALRDRFVNGEDLDVAEVDEQLLLRLDSLVAVSRNQLPKLPEAQRAQASARVETLAARVAELHRKKEGN